MTSSCIIRVADQTTVVYRRSEECDPDGPLTLHIDLPFLTSCHYCFLYYLIYLFTIMSTILGKIISVLFRKKEIQPLQNLAGNKVLAKIIVLRVLSFKHRSTSLCAISCPLSWIRNDRRICAVSFTPAMPWSGRPPFFKMEIPQVGNKAKPIGGFSAAGKRRRTRAPSFAPQLRRYRAPI